MAEPKKTSSQTLSQNAVEDIFGYALDSEKPVPPKTPEIPEGTRILLPRGEIEPWELNPRRHYDETELRDLGQHIKERGQINDLIVRPLPGHPGFWQLLGGERRWRSTAPEFADVPQLWVKVFYPADDAAALDLAWADNAKRVDLTAMENARYARLRRQMARDRGEADTLHAVGRAAGLSHERVRQIENLLELPDYITAKFDSLELNEKHGRALLMLSEFGDEQRTLFVTIERSSLSGNAALKKAGDLRKQAEKDAAEAAPKAPGLFDEDEAEDAATATEAAPISTRSVELEANTSAQPAQTGNADDGDLENDNWRSGVHVQNAGQGGVGSSAPAGEGVGFATVPEAGATDRQGPRQAPDVPGRAVADQLRAVGRFYNSGAPIPARLDQEVDMAIAEIEIALSQLKMARKTREGEPNAN